MEASLSYLSIYSFCIVLKELAIEIHFRPHILYICIILYSTKVCTYNAKITREKPVNTLVGRCILVIAFHMDRWTQWRRKMFLNRGAVNKIACKERKRFPPAFYTSGAYNELVPTENNFYLGVINN